MTHPGPHTAAAEIDRSVGAVLFDLDGVLTPTADVHRQVWKEVLTRVASSHAADPCTDEDYYAHIDGKPRLAGVQAFLSARSLQVPLGNSIDPPSTSTQHAIASLKNSLLVERLVADGVAPYADAVHLLDRLADAGLRLAVVSSSRNAKLVLAAAALADRFEHVVDGTTAAAHQLLGKPSPETFWHAARLLHCDPMRAVVVEDAVSGVQAGRDGGFALTIGVDRGAGGEQLIDAGADVVVTDLTQVEVLAR